MVKDSSQQAMIRPRTGSFTYTEYELDVMVAEIQAFKSMGVAGVVFGCLLPDGQIDLYSTTRSVKASTYTDGQIGRRCWSTPSHLPSRIRLDA